MANAKLSVKRFSSWDPEHQRQFLKFYGNTTPEAFASMGSASQRSLLARARGASKTASSPSSVTDPQSLSTVYKAAENAADLKYGDDQQALGDEQKISAAQQGRLTDYFSQYQQQLKDIAAANQKAYDSAATDVTDVANRNAQSDQTRAADQAQALAATAAQTGGQVDGSIAAKADQAASNRQALTQAVADQIKANKATDTAFEGNVQTAAAGSGIQEHLKENNRASDLRSKLRDLLKEKGEYENSTRQDLISNERKNTLEQATLQSQILGNQTQAAADVAKTTAKTQADDAKVNQYGYTNSEWQDMSASDRQAAMIDYDKRQHDATTAPKDPKKDKTKPATGPGSISSAAETKLVSTINSYLTQLKNPPLWDRGPGKGKVRMTKDEVYKELLSKGADGRIVSVADSLYRNNGNIGPNGVKQAHDLGIHVNGRWKQVKMPTGAAAYPDKGSGSAGQ